MDPGIRNTNRWLGVYLFFTFLGLQETPSFETFSSNIPIELLLRTLFFSSVA